MPPLATRGRASSPKRPEAAWEFPEPALGVGRGVTGVVWEPETWVPAQQHLDLRARAPPPSPG